MALTQIDIKDFRNFTTLNLTPLPTGFNFIYGQNGSGKTSLLEAIYYLSLGRSFRSSSQRQIIRHSAEKFVIFGRKLTEAANTVGIGIERLLQGDLKIKIGGNDVQSATHLAEVTPIQLINSNCYSLLDGGPLYKRKYLDWGAFYLNENFFTVWKEHGQVLKQRNMALKAHLSVREIRAWSCELIRTSLLLTKCRTEYLSLVSPLISEFAEELLNLKNLAIKYRQGWDESSDYEASLEASFERDCQVGFTQLGPHRADLSLTINGMLVKDILSRGQQKLFICAMMLAQGATLKNLTNKKPIYLIDDLPAELDKKSRSNLIALLSKQQTQVFVTAVEREALSTLIEMPTKMFHVEHGCLTEVL